MSSKRGMTAVFVCAQPEMMVLLLDASTREAAKGHFKIGRSCISDPKSEILDWIA